MSDRNHTFEDPSGKRKQRRYKTNQAQALRCEAEVDSGQVTAGTVVDLSNSGMRLLCSGQFHVGEKIKISLEANSPTDMFIGVIKYVEPWVGGQTILGCNLDGGIDDSVLHKLADQGFLNRRSDPRIEVTHPATMFWPLHSDRVDIELRDYSNGGLMIHSEVSIPDDKRLRVCIDGEEDSDLCVETKLQWKRVSDKGYVAGLAFVHNDAPQRVAKVLGLMSKKNPNEGRKTSRRFVPRMLLVGLAAMLVLSIAIAVLEFSGIKLPWAMVFSR
ncbi:MAG: PilZ domain-containing protein [Rubripirellula sp.]|nr:PilZ domain-containing protein [Rubripirellula sp.]